MSRSLDDWLTYAQSVNPRSVVMGLDRVQTVADQMGLLPLPSRSIIVAGTNGKGTTCIGMESILRAHDVRVGTTLSPHINRFNERVRIDGREADDEMLCDAFTAVEAARGDVQLTYFEYSTLVTLWCFAEAEVDIAILEIGLGGRLDAFNIVDADVAVITSIGFDHQEFLGDTLEAIGAEKAGVLRPGQRVVLGADMPDSVTAKAQALSCETASFDQAFRAMADRDSAPVLLSEGCPWQANLPSVPVSLSSRLPAHNMALAVVAVAGLMALSAPATEAGLAAARLRGRFERYVRDGRRIVVDVAHNPHGAAFLHGRLTQAGELPKAAVLGTLAGKDCLQMARVFAGDVKRWAVAPTEGFRAQSAEDTYDLLRSELPQARTYPSVGRAIEACLNTTASEDVILVFGSFAVVDAAHRWLEASNWCPLD